MANSLNKVTTKSILDATVATADIADDAVTLAKMAAGTDGQIITYDASGNPTAVGPGTDGQVLTSTGAGSPPAFEAIPAGVGGATGVDFNDSVKARFGTGNDLEIYHDGTNNQIKCAVDNQDITIASSKDLYLKTGDGSTGTHTFLYATDNAGVELRYDNAKKLETTEAGIGVSDLDDNSVQITLTTAQGLAGTLYANTAASPTGSFGLHTTAGEKAIETYNNGAVELYWDNEKRLETGQYGVTMSENLYMADTKFLYVGSGADLVLHHNTDVNYIDSRGRTTYIRNLNTDGNATETMAKFVPNGSVELYYDNTKTFHTVAGGTQVPASNKIYVGAFNNNNGFANFSDGGGSATLYVGNQSITTSSDKRLKKNIVDTEIEATSKLNEVRVVDFNWDDPTDTAINNKNSRGLWTGCLAQEIVDIFPHAVNAPRPDGKEIDHESESKWLMEYQHLVPVLIKGFQEQQAEIETLKTKVAALEAK